MAALRTMGTFAAGTASSMLIIFWRIVPLKPPALPFQHMGWIAKQAASITTCGGGERKRGREEEREGWVIRLITGGTTQHTHTLRPFVSVLMAEKRYSI